MSVVDLQAEQPAWELKLDAGIRPMTFEAGPDGSTRRVYAQLSNLNGFAVVDFAARKQVEKIKLPDDPTGYGVQENRLDSPSHGIGVAPDGKTLSGHQPVGQCRFCLLAPRPQVTGTCRAARAQVRQTLHNPSAHYRTG